MKEDVPEHLRPTLYPLAVDVDRTLKLNLSNGQLGKLVEMLALVPDPKEKARQLMREDRESILRLIGPASNPGFR